MSGAGRQTLAGQAERIGRAVETFLLVVVLGAMITLAAGQIVLRNFWGIGFAWADEALRIMVLWVTMLGAVAASRDQRHVSIDALSRYLPPGLQRPVAALVRLFAGVVCLVLTWYSYTFVEGSRAAGDQMLGGAVPAWFIQLIIPVGFGLLGYRYLVSCLLPVGPSRTDGAAH